MHLPQLFASPPAEYPSRRQFLRRAGSGAGLVALAALLEDQGLLAPRRGGGYPGRGHQPDGTAGLRIFRPGPKASSGCS